VSLAAPSCRAYTRDAPGSAGLVLQTGRKKTGVLSVVFWVFSPVLLPQARRGRFVSFKPTLFCDRGVVGGWERTDEPIKPYTTAETMDAGWCWQIEHEHRINRGYVYSSDFISDDEAEKEFRAKKPRVGPTRVGPVISRGRER